MGRNIVVERIMATPTEEQVVEIVERKGLGHPDFMADSIAEAYSRNLSRHYISNFGRILHHNVDKLEIIGGKTAPDFGGGTVVVPLSILFSGRATDTFENRDIPVQEIARNSARDWIRGNLRFVDADRIRYLFETKSGAASLSNIYLRKGVFSNDTSFGVGYAPLSTTEKLVLGIERTINGNEFKKRFPYSGEDVKVLASRIRKDIDLTVAVAFVDRYIESLDDYFEKKADLVEYIRSEAGMMVADNFNVSLSLNGMDDRSQGKDGCYLTVTGTSAEHGDDGAVGRGNRINGLITPNRLMSFEAIAGKNPVNHIGKIYNILAFDMADRVYRETGKHVTVKIAGRIGEPIDAPIITVITASAETDPEFERTCRNVADEMISGIAGITDRLVDGKISVC